MKSIKKLKKLVVFTLFVCIALLNTQVNLYANNYATITENTYCIVTKVFDGETFEAKNINNDTYYLIKMIGVDSKGYTEAYQYTYNRLMGKKVLITLDRLVTSPIGRWNNCYVRENGEIVNTKLIALGYGIADLDTSNDTIYNQYVSIENSAKKDNLGIWSEPSVDGKLSNLNNRYSKDSININTATKAQLQYKLDGVNSTIANNIVNYRKYRPFNQVSDIKFVEGMTKKIYLDNFEKMHVVTNINEAYEYELSTLLKISTEDAQDIIDYRDKKSKISVEGLLDDDIITTSQYNNNIDFITDENIDRINLAISKYTANINTATESQLTNAGLSTSNAKAILKIVDTGYTIKTVGELQFSSRVGLTDSSIRKLLDNLTVYTDINYSNEYELRSLFGDGYNGLTNDIRDIIEGREYTSITQVNKIISGNSYQNVRKLIYVDKFETSYININTATKEQLMNIGIGSTATDRIISERQKSIINDYTELPNNVDLRDFDNSISLFTNINNTSIIELTSLSEDINSTFANLILKYVEEQPFGSLNEVKQFFKDNNKEKIFYEIEDFIVLY